MENAIRQPELDIRDAGNADTDRIKALIYQVLAEYDLKPDPAITDRDLDTIEQSYFRDNGYFGVIERDGDIVATVAIRRVDENRCELRKMYALSSQRGRGLGKRLLEFALFKAHDLGYRQVVLETASVLQEAIGLYRKYGFRPYHPEQYSPRCDLAFLLNLDD